MPVFLRQHEHEKMFSSTGDWAANWKCYVSARSFSGYHGKILIVSLNPHRRMFPLILEREIERERK